MSNELKVKFVLDLSEVPASAQKALDIFNSKFSSNASSMSNAQMDKLIDQSGILKAGEKSAENFSKGFKGKMKGYGVENKELWKAILPDMPDFMQDPGFFTRGKKKGTVVPAPPKIPIQETVKIKDVLVGGIATLFNPFVGSMMLSNSMKGKQGGGIFSAMGQMSYGETFVAVKALSLAFSGLAKVVKLTMDSYEAARKFYAKSLTSGLGLGFTVKRNMVADILGVSETEVVKFGWSLNYLGNRTSNASKIIADTTPRLALVSWEFQILGKDLSALFAKIADEAQPAIMMLVHALDMMVQAMLNNAKLFHAVMMALGMPRASASFVKDFQPGGNKTVSPFSAPNPQSFMKQLPASSWEHMGLAIGGGGSTTNDLIRKSNSYLSTIAHAVVQGQPRGNQFSLNPNTNNP